MNVVVMRKNTKDVRSNLMRIGSYRYNVSPTMDGFTIVRRAMIYVYVGNGL